MCGGRKTLYVVSASGTLHAVSALWATGLQRQSSLSAFAQLKHCNMYRLVYTEAGT